MASKDIKFSLTSGPFAQSCPALCEPMDYSPPGSSVHWILQARRREWIAMPSSKRSSQPRPWNGLAQLGAHTQPYAQTGLMKNRFLNMFNPSNRNKSFQWKHNAPLKQECCSLYECISLLDRNEIMFRFRKIYVPESKSVE
ncbi:unnamed protein product [Rangifer tarandus platyrhynchus]|uniref:Uncharacterized protein n=1 Tax=Rangifer tarandus platyrhynchus TaxID=3082113 RepID=A0AC59Z880_RANTA